jgi:hypothetical protein
MFETVSIAEWIGVFFYSFNKIFFYFRESAGVKGYDALEKRLALAAWTCGLIGLPFVTWLLLHQDDYIFGWLELGAGVPMMFSWYFAVRGITDPKLPAWADGVEQKAIIFGVAFCIGHFGWGLFGDLGRFVDRMLELVAAIAFLRGNYYLLKDDRTGYFWYVGMFAVTCILLYRQGNVLFPPQQIASGMVIIAAYLTWKFGRLSLAALYLYRRRKRLSRRFGDAVWKLVCFFYKFPPDLAAS